MRKDIRKIVTYYKRKFETSNPFEIADALHIELAVGDIGTRAGCYMYLKRHKCIFINENLDEHEKMFVMSHELGHAILHPQNNCYFIRNKTFLSGSKIEIEANMFAMELLIDDAILKENQSLSIEQLSRLFGYHEKLIELRLRDILIS